MSIKKGYKNIFVVIFPMMMILLLFVALIGVQQSKEYRSKAYAPCSEGCHDGRWCGNDGAWEEGVNDINDYAYGCKKVDGTPTTPTPIPTGRENKCSPQKHCIGILWCGNDGMLHDAAGLTEGCRNIDGVPTTPTPVSINTPTTKPGTNANACPNQSSCIDGRWCGNDGTWEEGVNDINDYAYGCKKVDGTPTTPTPTPTGRAGCGYPPEHCVGTEWCGNDNAFHPGLIEGCRDINGVPTTPTPAPTLTPTPISIPNMPRTQSANAASWGQVQTLAVEGKVNATQISTWVNEAAKYYYPGIKTKFCDPLKGECDFKVQL